MKEAIVVMFLGFLGFVESAHYDDRPVHQLWGAYFNEIQASSAKPQGKFQ
eukprot:CAMPEP_0174266012 /NCGR_PEP_ID=MMETSP0439-20130205/28646_1 /TAXON_ID=0 /ORGANISM="Stereomyxa ramosa, Strain Chinc5" /LENGTH=49 /DNA_ID= /DNA_START= /DNA_END= /DNA_ORIENTATION=